MSAGNPDQKVYVYAVFSSLKYSPQEGPIAHQIKLETNILRESANRALVIVL